MKTLICAKDIEDLAATGGKVLQIDDNTIVTPAAYDTAKLCGIELAVTEAKQIQSQPVVSDPEFDSKMIYQALKAMMNQGLFEEMMKQINNPLFICEQHSSGLKIIDADSIQYERVETGNQSDQIYCREVYHQEKPELKAGYYKIEHSCLEQESQSAELVLVLDGELEVSLGGQTYRAKEGDMLYVPKHTKVAWKTKTSVRMFYLAYEDSKS